MSEKSTSFAEYVRELEESMTDEERAELEAARDRYRDEGDAALVEAKS